jgi:signal transduction histidine kinase
VNGPRWRLLTLGVVGVLLVTWSTYGPFMSDHGIHWSINLRDQSIRFAGGLLLVAAMLVAYRRDPGGRLWKLMLVYIASAGLWTLPSSNVAIPVTYMLSRLFDGLSPIIFIHIVLAFPSGRLANGFDRGLVTALYGLYAATRIAWVLVYDSTSDVVANALGLCGSPPDCAANPFLIWANADLAWLFGNPGAIGLTTPLVAVVVAVRLWLRWRHGSPVLRRALLPVVVATPIQLVLFVVWDLAGVQQAQTDWIRVVMLNPFFGIPLWLIPAGFLIGLLRTRLARGSIADLVVKVGEGVPLGGLRDTLAQTLRDPSLVVAFPAPSGAGFVDPQGQRVEVPANPSPSCAVTRLERDGELLALLIHDPAIDAEDPGLVEAVGSVARLTLENERLGAQVRAQLDEVRASRARIVEAADAERRRIERDLHDGAQQRLVALAMRLEQARTRSRGAAELIDATTAELQMAIDEVRRLARGLHPTILTEAGLAAAVEALAERAPVVIRAKIVDKRYPAVIEIAAYYVIAEALTNIARYARASEARIEVTAAEDRLIVRVSDNGQGGADPEAGTGLRGLADRLAAIGGHLEVTSPSGGGTIVIASMPAMG